MMNVLNYPANQMETRSSLSRSLHTNRGLEKLEPYEGKLSCTVLRGEEGSNALDLPDRPSDLQQRDGRGVRAGNEIAKHFAGNNIENKMEVSIAIDEAQFLRKEVLREFIMSFNNSLAS